MNYLITLIPFREDFEVTEHQVIIDTSNIPILLGDSSLVYAKSVYCNSKYYGREQLLLIYSKDYQIKKGSVLSDYNESVCSMEQKRLENKNNELQDEWQKMNDELHLSRENFKVLDQKYKKLDSLNDELKNMNLKLKSQNYSNCKQKGLLNKKIQELNKELINLNKELCKSEKNTSQIYIFACIPYYDIGGGQRSSQLARTFNKMGYDVYYYYAFDSSESKKFNLRLPLIDHKSINDTTVKNIFSSIKENALFIFEAPYIKFIPYLLRAKELGIKTIYEHIDNWETSLGALLYDKDTLYNLFR
ncbi:hypothetical protein [uncultured Clostridium sp.]|uniref:hypothetical protein n=1 Tax=uncultured Clostridium sp. TaxID=59620 RepID=UPI0025CC356F|nr:hypothetical protein [uncultured Clostridium sp.]